MRLEERLDDNGRNWMTLHRTAWTVLCPACLGPDDVMIISGFNAFSDQSWMVVDGDGRPVCDG